MTQEVAYFDEAEHASGSQSARLAADTAAIRGAVGDQLGALTQSLVTFIAGAALNSLGPGALRVAAERLCYGAQGVRQR